jgi:RimJ/RimL family protein N-acetyltransferase
MKPIRTERLILRNWEDRDRELFHRINSDERVMEFFPFRRNRAQADAKMDEFRAWIAEDGYGFAAAEIAAIGECIGFVGLLDTDHLPDLPAGTVEIGWGWRRNSGDTAMSPRQRKRGLPSASKRLGSMKSYPSPLRTIAVPPPSCSASA